MARQLPELVLEQLRRPELRGGVRKMLALAAADLVVQDAATAEAAELGDGLTVVMRRSWASVADDDRCAASV